MKPLPIKPSDYHARLKCDRANLLSPDSWLSKSVLWELASSSLYKWRFAPPEKSVTPAMQWGSLIDCLTTTPELADEQIAVCPFDSYRTNDAKNWRDARLGEGKIIVAESDMERAKQAASMLTETCRASAEIFAASKSQVIVAGKIHGIQCKGLVDLAPEGADFLADLKTTSDFSLDGFQKKTAAFGYHVQAGLYLALWNSMFPDNKRERFKLVWQDAEAPFEVAVTELHRDEIDHGFRFADRWIGKLRGCTDSGTWPMAFNGVEPTIVRPTWAAMREEERGAA